MEKIPDNLDQNNTTPAGQQQKDRWWEKRVTGSEKRELVKNASEEYAADQVFADSAETEKDALNVDNGSDERRETHTEWLERRKDEIEKIAEEKYQKRILESESDESRSNRIKEAKDKDPLLYQNLSDEKILENLDWFDAEDEYKKDQGTIKRSKASRINGDKDSTEKKQAGELNDKKEGAVTKAEEDKKESEANNAPIDSSEKNKKSLKERAKKLRDIKYGVDQSSAGWRILMNLLKSAGSITGTRFFYEGGVLIGDWRRKKKVGNITEDLLKASQTMPKIRIPEIEAEAEKIKHERERNETLSYAQTNEMIRKNGLEPNTDGADKFMMEWDKKEAVKRLRKEKGLDGKEGQDDAITNKNLNKYRELREKLAKAKMPPEEKEKLRSYLASILKEYRHKDKESKDVSTKKIERVLDTYMDNTAQKLLFAKESLNFISIGLAAPYLRGAIYSGSALIEKSAKAMSDYDKKHFDINKDKESLLSKINAEYIKKRSAVIKDAFVNSFHETARGLSFNLVFKEKEKNKSNRAKGGEFASAFLTTFFTALRFAGLAEYGYAGHVGKLPTQDIYKIKDMIVNGDIGDAGKQMLQNWLGNMERLAGGVDRLSGGYISNALKGTVGYAEKMTGYDIHNYLGMKSSGGSNVAVDYEKFNKVFGSGPRGEVPSVEDIQKVQISTIFGADSPLGHKIMEGGVTSDEARLLGSLKEFGLHASDFHNFQGSPEELNHLVDQVSKLNLGVGQPGMLKELINDRALAAKLDNPAVQNILKSKFGGEHIKDILSAKQVATIDKPGGSISEVLHMAMRQNDKVTVVNPDGKTLYDFDANLAHQGDTVISNADGSITVFKTSDVSVKAGQSLDNVYASIAEKVNKAGAPKEIQDVFNRGVGHWGEKITRGESEKMLHWWSENKTAYDYLTHEQQQEFLQKIHSMKSEAEISKALNEISNAPVASAAEAPASVVGTTAHPIENITPIGDHHDAEELKIESAPDASRWPLANQQHSKSDNKIFEFSANRTIVDRITTIFGEKKAQFSASADLDRISAWKDVKDKLASDVLSDKFNKPTGWFGWMSGRKTRAQYDDLQKYLINLNKNHKIQVNENEKETVADYIKRAEEWLSRERVYK